MPAQGTWKSRRSARVLMSGLMLLGVVLVVTAGPGSAPAAAAVAAGPFHPLPPARIFDSRLGLGGPAGAVGPGQVASVQVTGRGAVPASGVAAVVMNVTVVSPTAASYLTVYPAGADRPNASNLNYDAGQTVPNLVQVAVGSQGRVEAFNAFGSAHVIVDVAGWVADTGEPGTAGLFKPLTPSRVLDTRLNQGGSIVGPGETLDVQLAGAGGVPATGAAAVVLNLTVTGPTAESYLTAFPAGQERPTASNLNYVAGDTVPNRVIVRLGEAGRVSLFNFAGSTHLIADVAGWYTDGSDPEAFGASFSGMVPTRFTDTRATAPLAPGATLRVPVSGLAGIPAMDVERPPTAVVANLTVTQPTAGGYLTAFPAQQAQPVASDLNFGPGTTRPNLAIVKLGPDGAVEIFNSDGHSHVIVDVLGWYSGDIVVDEQLEVLDAPALAALQQVAPDGTLVFSSAAGNVADVQVGDIVNAGLSAATPEGLLRRVTSVAPEGSTVRMTTEQASVADALSQGSLAQAAPIDAANMRSFEPAVDGVTVTPVPATARAGSGAVAVSAGLRLSISNTKTSGDETWTLTTAGTLDVHGEASVWADVGFFDLDAGMDVKAEQTLSLSVTGEGTAAGLTIETFLGRINMAPLIIPAGPVIVVVIPHIDVKLATEGTMTVSLSGSLQQTASVSAGVKYDDGFSTHRDSDFDILGWQFQGPEAGLKLKSGPVLDIRTDLYGLAGPSVAIKPYVSYEIEPCREKLSAGIDAGIGFKGKIWKFDLADYEATIGVYAAVLHEVTRGDCGSGDVQVSLLWNTDSDLDLHVVDPAGEEIYYGNPASASGGTLDFDIIPDAGDRSFHIENVFWPTGAAPAGTYTAFIHHFSSHAGAASSYSMQVKVNGTIIHSETGTLAEFANSPAFSFSLGGGGAGATSSAPSAAAPRRSSTPTGPKAAAGSATG